MTRLPNTCFSALRTSSGVALGPSREYTRVSPCGCATWLFDRTVARPVSAVINDSSIQLDSKQGIKRFSLFVVTVGLTQQAGMQQLQGQREGVAEGQLLLGIPTSSQSDTSNHGVFALLISKTTYHLLQSTRSRPAAHSDPGETPCGTCRCTEPALSSGTGHSCVVCSSRV